MDTGLATGHWTHRTWTKSMLNQTELMLFVEQTTIMKSWGAGQMESDSVGSGQVVASGQ